MTVPLACVLVAYLLIFLPRIFVMRAQAAMPEGYDNKSPREQQARLTGWGKRAHAAHANAFEAFAPFAAAVLVSHVAHANPRWATVLALVFVVSRTIYPFVYIADLATLRSTVWGIGMFATIGLFVLPWLG